MSNLVKKITPKTVCGDVLTFIKERNPNPKKGHSVLLFDLLGIASGVRTGQSNYGEWLMFTGQFEAVNLDTGEVFNAPQCALPEPVQSMLKHAMTQHDSADFALRVGAKIVDAELSAHTHYEYTVSVIKKIDEADALSALRDMRTSFALPAPESKDGDEAPKAKGKKK